MTLLSTSPAVPGPDARARTATASGRSVPWSTVLTLAVVLAYADGFWMTSLQNAVGAIERVQDPVTSFWRLSTALLPVFALAVLAGLTLALRRWGPVPGRRQVAGTVALVAVAATGAAVLVSAGNSLYDYTLQSQQMAMMQAMHTGGGCDVACLDRQQMMTLTAHGRALGYIGVAVLLTNLVLVAWAVALRGGRLPVVARARVEATPGTRRSDLTRLLVAGLLGSAVIHAAVVPEHLDEWAAAGLFFVLLTLAELVAADALLRRPGPSALVVAVAVSLTPLAVWCVSRTAGLPFGPEVGTPEAVGLADVVACLLELGTLVGALALLHGPGRVRGPRASAHARALALLAVVAVTAVGVGGVVPAWVDGAAPGTSVTGTVHHR